MVRSKATHARPRRLVVGVTVGVSADLLLRGQLAWFREQGWDVTLVTSPDHQAERAAAREQVNLVGVSMARSVSPLQDLVAFVRWIRVLRRIRPDAVNVGTPKAGLLGTVAAWFLRVPRRIYTVRGLRLEGSTGFFAKVLWMMEWITMRASTDVLFVSKSLAAEARARGLPVSGKARLVGHGSSNGVDAEAIANRVAEVDRNQLRADLGFAKKDFIVGFVGRIDPDKGVDVILKAVQDPGLDTRVKVLMIGSFESPRLQWKVETLAPRITHVDWSEDVWRYLPAMDVLCLPTRREGFPNVVLEAAAAGVPSITTKATGAIDAVVPGVTGEIIDIDDHLQLAEILNVMSTSPCRVEEQGRAARARVATEFRPESIWKGISLVLLGEPQREGLAGERGFGEASQGANKNGLWHQDITRRGGFRE